MTDSDPVGHQPVTLPTRAADDCKKMRYAASPDVVTIPEPDTARFRLHVAPGVLPPGEYSVSALAKLVLEEDPRTSGRSRPETWPDG